MKSWLKDSRVEIYSNHHDGKSVVTEKFIRTLKKIYRYLTSISKNEYIGIINVANKYNSTYHRTIEMPLMLEIIVKILNLKL